MLAPKEPESAATGAAALVRAARTDDVPSVAAVLQRAFQEDPVANYLLASAHRKDALAAFFALQLRRSYLPRGGAVVATKRGAPGVILGAALVAGPHASVARVADATLSLALWRLLRGTYRPARHLGRALAARRPPGPHFYVGTVGVDPLSQRQGIGSDLLAPLCARADAEGCPTFLECSREENVPFYARLGFALDTVLSVGGAPPLWLMTRPARTRALFLP